VNIGQAAFIKPNLMASTGCEPTSAPTDSAFQRIHHGAIFVSNTSVKVALSRMTADDSRWKVILSATGFTIGFAIMATAELIQPTPPPPPPQKTPAAEAAQEPVRIVGVPFVPNVNPSER
jgi:hypothetical protein